MIFAPNLRLPWPYSRFLNLRGKKDVLDYPRCPKQKNPAITVRHPVCPECRGARGRFFAFRSEVAGIVCSPSREVAMNTAGPHLQPFRNGCSRSPYAEWLNKSILPPSTVKVWAVIKAASGETRNSDAPSTSSDYPT